MDDKRKYVLLKHSHKGNPLHWDLMLEEGGVLLTWRLEELLKGEDRILQGEKIFDHPMKFLNYEGAVNKGQGAVKRIDEGVYSIIKKSDKQTEIFFEGKLLLGEFILKTI